MKQFVWALVAFTLLVSNASSAERAKAVKLPGKRNLHIYLLMGQSNMAGRGKVETEDQTPHHRVLVLTRSNTWELAVEPVTRDRASGLGVGPGLAFGKAMAAKNSKPVIALVPCAVGGTPLSRWSKGGDLYSNAVARARVAMKKGTLKGILWHQGENDSIRAETAETYGERLQQMIVDFRAELKAPKTPFVVGQIGEFLYTRKDPTKTPYARVINEALAQIPIQVPHTGCVKSNGLKHSGDEVHFDTESCRELGRRFAEEMAELQKK